MAYLGASDFDAAGDAPVASTPAPAGVAGRLRKFEEDSKQDAVKRHSYKAHVHSRAAEASRQRAKRCAGTRKASVAVAEAESHDREARRHAEISARCSQPTVEVVDASARARTAPTEESLDSVVETYAFDGEPAASVYATTEELSGDVVVATEESQPQDDAPSTKKNGAASLAALGERCKRWIEVRRNVKCPTGNPADSTCRLKARVVVPCAPGQEAALVASAGLTDVRRLDGRCVSAVVALDDAHVGADGTLYGYGRDGGLYGVDPAGVLGKHAASGMPQPRGNPRRSQRSTSSRGNVEAAPARGADDEPEYEREHDREREHEGEEIVELEYIYSPKLDESNEVAFDGGAVFEGSGGGVDNVDGGVMDGGEHALTADALSGYDPEGGGGLEGHTEEEYDEDGAFGYEDLSNPGPIPELDRGVVVNDFNGSATVPNPSRSRGTELARRARGAGRAQGRGSNQRASSQRTSSQPTRYGMFGAKNGGLSGMGATTNLLSSVGSNVASAVQGAATTAQKAQTSYATDALTLERERLAAQERADQRAAEERESAARMNLFSNIFGSATQAAGTIVPNILQSQAQKDAQRAANKLALAQAQQPIIYQSAPSGQGNYLPWIVGGVVLLGVGGLIAWSISSSKGK